MAASFTILHDLAGLVFKNANLFVLASPYLVWTLLPLWRPPRNPSLSIQYRYLRRVGGMFVLGTTMGISALALQGQFAPPFWLVLSTMLTAGFLCLRLISEAFLKGGTKSNVEYGKIDRGGLCKSYGFLLVGEGKDLVTSILESPLNQAPCISLVIQNQNSRHDGESLQAKDSFSLLASAKIPI